MAGDDSPRIGTDQPFPELFASIVRANGCGTLVANSDGVERRFIFVNGRQHLVSSQLEEEKLGAWLVAKDRITEGHKALALLNQSGGGSTPLGLLLLERGQIDEATLEDELKDLWLTITHRAAASSDTRCTFVEDDSTNGVDSPVDLNTSHLLLVAARAFDDIEAKKKLLGPGDKPVWPSRGLDALLTEVELTPTEAFLLSRLTATETLANLIQLSSLPEDVAVNTVYALTTIGAICTGPTPHPVPIPKAKNNPVLRKATKPSTVVEESTLNEAQLKERSEIQERAIEVTKTDHYSALGVNRAATTDEINLAWSTMQKVFSQKNRRQSHLKDLETQFNAIVERAQEAHDLLTNAKARRRYNTVLDMVEEEERRLKDGPGRIETDPVARKEIVEANFARARELVAEGEIYLAIKLLDHACKLEPRPTELVYLARLLLRNPQWTGRALAHLRHATELDPNLIEAWIDMAEFWRRRNHKGRQRNAIERALRIEPDNERAQTMYRQLTSKKALTRFIDNMY